jgi:hypothetical protein
MGHGGVGDFVRLGSEQATPNLVRVLSSPIICAEYGLRGGHRRATIKSKVGAADDG